MALYDENYDDNCQNCGRLSGSLYTQKNCDGYEMTICYLCKGIELHSEECDCPKESEEE